MYSKSHVIPCRRPNAWCRRRARAPLSQRVMLWLRPTDHRRIQHLYQGNHRKTKIFIQNRPKKNATFNVVKVPNLNLEEIK